MHVVSFPRLPERWYVWCRLEAQLEQERIIHEQELQCLRQQHKDAERNLDVALAETKESAETQRHQYEEQLQQLEHRLNEAKFKVVECEMNGKENAALIKRLENEKQVKHCDYGFTSVNCDKRFLASIF